MLALLALAHAEDLYVTSNERGAVILLNGVDTGSVTPATIRGVKPGRVEVAVESGCARGEALVDVAPGVTTRVSIVATEQLGTLSIVPTPPNARLELDGDAFSGPPGLPVAVSCGEHTVRASLDGYIPAIVTVDVGMGQDLTVPLTLQKLGIGTLELSVSPRSATIYLDGKPVGSDAVTLPSVYQGVHTISAELDGYQSAKKQVAVEADTTAAYHFDLARVSQKRQTSTVTKLGGEPEPAGTTETSGSGAGAVEAREVETREAEAREAEERRAKAAREAEAREAAAREAEAREAAEAEAEAREAEERRVKAAREADARAAAEREAEAREAAEAEEREAAEAEAREAAEAEAAEARAREAEERREKAAREAEAAEAAAREAEERREKAAREAEAREAARRARADTSSTARVPREGKPVGQTVAGISLLAVGAGAGAYGVLAYDAAARAYDNYTEQLDEAGADKQRQRLADAYYDDTVAPRQAVFYGTAIGSALFLAGGVVVLVVDHDTPTFVPAPGGGMLLWSGRF